MESEALNDTLGLMSHKIFTGGHLSSYTVEDEKSTITKRMVVEKNKGV
jgi:hypothetical protein